MYKESLRLSKAEQINICQHPVCSFIFEEIFLGSGMIMNASGKTEPFYCTNCGTKLLPGTVFCTQCGKKQTAVPTSANDVSVVKEQPAVPKKEHYSFRVAGVTFENRQKIFKDIVKAWKEITEKEELWEGYSNKEIKEDLMSVQEISIADYTGVILKKEPTNQYDANAIAVYYEEQQVGFVPKTDLSAVHKIIENKDFKVFWNITGGRYKSYDDSEEKIVVDDLDYGMEISLTWENIEDRNQ